MTTHSGETHVNVAVVQMDCQVGLENKENNVNKTLGFIDEAVRNGANLVVLPELCSTGYTFEDRFEAFEHAESVPEGPTTERWIKKAREEDIYIVAGIAEQDGVKLYDTAVLVGPEGFIGKYRKTHLFNKEKLYFTPGEEGYPVFDTKIGRIGLLICWDIWFPEVPRILNMQGADIVCSCNDWVFTPPPLFDETGKCMASYLTMAASHVNNMFIAASDRVGVEKDAKFLGCSLITGPNGWPVEGPADAESEKVLQADINLSQTRSAPIWNDLNDLVRDRRTDLYDEMLGYTLGKKAPR